MRKISALLTLLVLVGCQRVSQPDLLITHWEKKFDRSPLLERKLASGANGQCMNDIFDLETLRAEMELLEREHSAGRKVQGQWRHLDLSRLPIPQANFLKSFGDKIGDLKNKDSIDYTSCSDLPCIFNKIYGKEDHVAGYVHYLWYLKFGQMLSADNLVPGGKAGQYDGKVVPLSDYLYNDKELYGLWRLSHMLERPFTSLASVKEIQRLPRGHSFEDKDKNGNDKYAGACGLASSAGWIKMQDGCFSIHGDNDLGYFYVALTHELAHQVDFDEGRRVYRHAYRSHQKDYLDVSGFYLKEWVDERGVKRSQWAHREGIKLLREYSGGSPQENFADALAYFRHKGDKTLTDLTTDHQDFVFNNYYFDRAFDKASLYDHWLKKYASETSKEVFKSVVDCSKGNADFNSTFFTNRDFSSPVLPGMLKCFGQQAELVSRSIRAKIMLKEPEGCNTLKDSGTTKPLSFLTGGNENWAQAVKGHLRDEFDRHLQEVQNDPDYLARIQKYYDQIADKAAARGAYLQCFGEANEKECYDKEVGRRAFEMAQELRLSLQQTREMAEMYVNYHPFNQVQKETSSFYRSFVSSNMEIVRKEGDDLWQACSFIPHDDLQPPTGSLFRLSQGYMISSFYNCLNAQLPSSVRNIVSDLSVEGVKAEHPAEERILSMEVRPKLVEYLQSIYAKEKTAEARGAERVIREDKGKLRERILSNFDWVKNVIDSEQILSDCRKQAYGLIDLKPLFHLPAELFRSYLDHNSCFNVSSTSAFNQWLENTKGVFQERVGENMESKLMALAEARAKVCVQRYPVDSNLNRIRFKRQREACLTDEWQGMENKVLEDMQNDPLVKKFEVDAGVLKVKLESNRRRLQIRIFRDYFN